MKRMVLQNTRARDHRSRFLNLPLFAFALLPLLTATGVQAQTVITATGQTATTINNTGSTTTVTTTTIAGGAGLNAFARFQLGAGDTANLVLPNGTTHLINTVRDGRMDVYGVLNGIKDGKIGGNLYFLTPNGMLVGQGGVINAGAFSAATAPANFLDKLYTPGLDQTTAITDTLSGKIPISGSGLITVNGTINAAGDIMLQGGNVTLGVGGLVQSSAAFTANADFSNVVNTTGLGQAGGVVVKSGVVTLLAADTVQIDGQVRALGGAGVNAGDITVEGKAVKLGDIARFSVRGTGAQSNGGDVTITSEGAFKVGSGNIDAGSDQGEAGEITLTGSSFDISKDWHTGGGALVFNATDSITVREGVTLSTRKTAGGDAETALSTGDSGDLLLHAPQIFIKPRARLLTFATPGFFGGDLALYADANKPFYYLDDFNGFNADALIDVDGAILKGGNVTLLAIAQRASLFGDAGGVEKTEETDAYVNYAGRVGDAVEDADNNFGQTLGNTLASSWALAPLKLSLNNVRSRILIKDSWIEATRGGDLVIQSIARSRAEVGAFFGLVLSLGVLTSETTAVVEVSGATNLRTGGGGDLFVDSLTDTTHSTRQNTFPSGRAGSIAAGVAYSYINSDSHVLIGSNTVANIEGQATFQARDIKEVSVGTTSGGGKGVFSAAVSINLTKSNVQALVGGKITAVDDVLINADQHFKGLKSSANARAGGESGLDQVGKVVALAGKAKVVGDIASGEADESTVEDGLEQDPETGANKKNANIKAAAGLSYTETDNKVEAKLAGDYTLADGRTGVLTADVQTPASLTVHAKENLEFYRASSITVEGKNPKDTNGTEANYGAAVSVVLGLVDNKVTAEIGAGAKVDAVEGTTVLAENLMPYENSFPSADGLSRGDPEDLKKLTEVIIASANPALGINSDLFSSWAQSNATAAKIAIAGNANYQKVDLATVARIASGAEINQRITPSVHSDVLVKATTDSERLNLSGIFDIFSKLTGTQSENGALGGTYLHNEYFVRTEALVEGGVKIRADALDVQATSDIYHVSIVEAGGEAKSWGFNGAGSYVKYEGDTNAKVDGGAIVDVRKLDLEALDKSNIVNVAGGFTKSENVGIGVSVAVNEINRRTSALIGVDPEKPSTILTGGSVRAGEVEATATTSGVLTTVALAAAVKSPGTASGEDNTSGSGGANGTSAKGGYGVGISGDLAYNKVSDTTRALIGAGATVNSDKVTLTADNTAGIVAVTGAAAMSKSTNGQSSVGLAGSVSVNGVSADTKAGVVGGAKVKVSDKLTIDARNDSGILAIAVGGSGDSGGATSVNIAGSVTINTITDKTVAAVEDSTVTAKSAEISATNDASMLLIAGALGLNKGTAGVGGAVALGYIGNVTEARIDTSQVMVEQDLALKALNSSRIESYAGAVAISGKAAIAGAVTINTVDDETRVALVNDAGAEKTVQAASLDATAREEAYVQTVAGAVAGAKNGAVGAAVAYNKIGGVVEAVGDHARVKTTSGAFKLGAENESTIRALAAAGGLASTAAVDVGVTTNFLDTEVAARLRGGSQVTTAGDLLVTARDLATIQSLAGGASFAGTGAVGGGVAYNQIGDHVIAQVTDGSKATSGADILVAADAKQTIQTLAAQISGSGTAAVAGAVAIAASYSTIDALIDGGAILVADSDALVTADKTNSFEIAGGGLAVSGTGAIAGAASVFLIDDDVTAKISGAGTTVDAKGAGAGSQVFDGFWDDSHNRTQRDLHGAAVVASSLDKLSHVTVAAGASGVAGLGASVAVAMVNGQSNASIDTGAKVNRLAGAELSQETLVGAYGDLTYRGISGGLGASGAASAGAGVETVLVTKSAKAKIDNAEVGGRKAVTVDAQTRDYLHNTIAGIGVGAYAGVAGSVSIYNVRNTTEASIRGGDVESQGDITVHAQNGSQLVTEAGSLGIGIVGVAGAVAVNTFDNQVTASIDGDAKVDAGKAAKVEAWNNDELHNKVGTIDIAGLAVQGNVTVNSIEGSTRAFIGKAQVNQDVAFRSASQDVVLRAQDGVFIDNEVGAIGVSIVGAGGSVDVTGIRKTVIAETREGANISAGGDIDVQAISDHDIDSDVATIEVAGLAGGASVSLLSFGAPADSVGIADLLPLGDTLNSEFRDTDTRDLISVDDFGKQTGERIQAARSALSVDFKDPTPGTTAARIGKGSALTAGLSDPTGRVGILADTGIGYNVYAGAVTATLIAGAGLGDGYVDVGTVTQSSVEDGVVVKGGQVKVEAVSGDVDGDINSIYARSGNGALVAAFGGVIAVARETRDTRVEIGKDARLEATGDLTLASHQTIRSLVDAQAIGKAGVSAGGYSDAQVSAKTTSVVNVGEGANLIAQKGDVIADATSVTNIESFSSTDVGATFTGFATAKGDATITNTSGVLLGKNAKVTAGDDASLTAKADLTGASRLWDYLGGVSNGELNTANGARITDNLTIVGLGQGASVTAADEAKLRAETRTDLYAYNRTFPGSASKAVAITHADASQNSVTRVELDGDARIKAAFARLEAEVTKLKLRAETEVDAKAGGYAYGEANGLVDGRSTADVVLKTGVFIEADKVALRARHHTGDEAAADAIDLSVHADGFAGATEAEAQGHARSNLAVNSTIDMRAGSTVHTDDFDAEALNRGKTSLFAYSNGEGVKSGESQLVEDHSTFDNLIAFNGEVVSANTPVLTLIIDKGPDGKPVITAPRGLIATISPSGEILVSLDTRGGKLRLNAPGLVKTNGSTLDAKDNEREEIKYALTPQPHLQPAGAAATITGGGRYVNDLKIDRIEIINRSDADVRVAPFPLTIEGGGALSHNIVATNDFLPAAVTRNYAPPKIFKMDFTGKGDFSIDTLISDISLVDSQVRTRGVVSTPSIDVVINNGEKVVEAPFTTLGDKIFDRIDVQLVSPTGRFAFDITGWDTFVQQPQSQTWYVDYNPFLVVEGRWADENSIIKVLDKETALASDRTFRIEDHQPVSSAETDLVTVRSKDPAP